MDIPGGFTLSSDVPIQFRRAQNVPDELARFIRQACTNCREIACCYLLDVRRTGRNDMALFVVVKVDQSSQFAVAARVIQDALAKTKSSEVYIVQNKSFPELEERHKGKEFYVRPK